MSYKPTKNLIPIAGTCRQSLGLSETMFNCSNSNDLIDCLRKKRNFPTANKPIFENDQINNKPIKHFNVQLEPIKVDNIDRNGNTKQNSESRLGREIITISSDESQSANMDEKTNKNIPNKICSDLKSRYPLIKLNSRTVKNLVKDFENTTNTLNFSPAAFSTPMHNGLQYEQRDRDSDMEAIVESDNNLEENGADVESEENLNNKNVISNKISNFEQLDEVLEVVLDIEDKIIQFEVPVDVPDTQEIIASVHNNQSNAEIIPETQDLNDVERNKSKNHQKSMTLIEDSIYNEKVDDHESLTNKEPDIPIPQLKSPQHNKQILTKKRFSVSQMSPLARKAQVQLRNRTENEVINVSKKVITAEKDDLLQPQSQDKSRELVIQNVFTIPDNDLNVVTDIHFSQLNNNTVNQDMEYEIFEVIQQPPAEFCDRSTIIKPNINFQKFPAIEILTDDESDSNQQNKEVHISGDRIEQNEQNVIHRSCKISSTPDTNYDSPQAIDLRTNRLSLKRSSHLNAKHREIDSTSNLINNVNKKREDRSKSNIKTKLKKKLIRKVSSSSSTSDIHADISSKKITVENKSKTNFLNTSAQVISNVSIVCTSNNFLYKENVGRENHMNERHSVSLHNNENVGDIEETESYQPKINIKSHSLTNDVSNKSIQTETFNITDIHRNYNLCSEKCNSAEKTTEIISKTLRQSPLSSCSLDSGKGAKPPGFVVDNPKQVKRLWKHSILQKDRLSLEKRKTKKSKDPLMESYLNAEKRIIAKALEKTVDSGRRPLFSKGNSSTEMTPEYHHEIAQKRQRTNVFSPLIRSIRKEDKKNNASQHECQFEEPQSHQKTRSSIRNSKKKNGKYDTDSNEDVFKLPTVLSKSKIKSRKAIKKDKNALVEPNKIHESQIRSESSQFDPTEHFDSPRRTSTKLNVVIEKDMIDVTQAKKREKYKKKVTNKENQNSQHKCQFKEPHLNQISKSSNQTPKKKNGKYETDCKEDNSINQKDIEIASEASTSGLRRSNRKQCPLIEYWTNEARPIKTNSYFEFNSKVSTSSESRKKNIKRKVQKKPLSNKLEKIVEEKETKLQKEKRKKLTNDIAVNNDENTNVTDDDTVLKTNSLEKNEIIQVADKLCKKHDEDKTNTTKSKYNSKKNLTDKTHQDNTKLNVQETCNNNCQDSGNGTVTNEISKSNPLVNRFDWLNHFLSSSNCSSNVSENPTPKIVRLISNDIHLASITDMETIEHEGLEYSFYNNRMRNIGFIKFLPNVQKPVVKLKKHNLNYILLCGNLEFNIANSIVKYDRPGDNIYVQKDTKYGITNSSNETALVFFIKST